MQSGDGVGMGVSVTTEAVSDVIVRPGEVVSVWVGATSFGVLRGVEEVLPYADTTTHAQTPERIKALAKAQWCPTVMANSERFSSILSVKYDQLVTEVLRIEAIDSVSRLNAGIPLSGIEAIIHTLASTKNKNELFRVMGDLLDQLPFQAASANGGTPNMEVSAVFREMRENVGSMKSFHDEALGDWIVYFCTLKLRGRVSDDNIAEAVRGSSDLQETLEIIRRELRNFGLSDEEADTTVAVAIDAVAKLVGWEYDRRHKGQVNKVEASNHLDYLNESILGALLAKGEFPREEVEQLWNLFEEILRTWLESRTKKRKGLMPSLFKNSAPQAHLDALPSLQKTYEAIIPSTHFLARKDIAERMTRWLYNFVYRHTSSEQDRFLATGELPKKDAPQLLSSVKDALTRGTMEFGAEVRNIYDPNTNKVRTEFSPFGAPIFEKLTKDINRGNRNNPSLRQLAMYADGTIYREYPQVPPSSDKPHVLRLQATAGCSWNKCTYCSLYGSSKFWITTINDFREHVRKVKAFLGEDESEDFERLFLTGGNALAIPTDRLLEMLAIVQQEFGDFRRVECYATTEDILRKGADDMTRLREAGLNMVYWGVESGSDEVLGYVNKRHRAKDIVEAGRVLDTADVESSVTIMPGLGGIKYSVEHLLDTIRVLVEIQPRYITLMGADPAPDSEYAKIMEQDKDNRVMTPEEVAQQIRAFECRFCMGIHRKSRRRYDIVMGAYGREDTPTAKNPRTFVHAF